MRNSFLNVRSFHGATMDTVHYMVIARRKLRFQFKKQKQTRFHLDKVKLKDLEAKRNLTKQFEKNYVQQEDLRTSNVERASLEIKP